MAETPEENRVLAMEEFRLGRTVVASTPILLTLESTSICNLRCVMCPHSIGGVIRPKHLEEALAEKMASFLRRASSAQLHGIGEPLASPSFWSMLAQVPESCDSSINTNLTLLDDSRLERLIGSNISMINVSVDAATPETYRKIRGHEFEELLHNIRRLIDARNLAGKSRPAVWLNMTIMRSNIEETPAFVELASTLGADAVCFWHLNRWEPHEMDHYRAKGFDYAAEGLWNYPELSNRYLREAMAVGERLNLPIKLDLVSKNIFFEENGEGL